MGIPHLQEHNIVRPSMRTSDIPLSLDTPRMIYMRGWGSKGLCTSPVLFSLTLLIKYLNGHLTFLTFDLFDDASPLIIGLDLSRYASTEFLAHPPVLTFGRPTDIGPRRLPIYISSNVPLRAIAHIYVPLTTAHGLLSTNLTIQRALIFSKRLHRFSHAPVPYMKRHLRRS